MLPHGLGAAARAQLLSDFRPRQLLARDFSVVSFFSSFSSQNTPRVDDTFGVRAGEVALRGIG